MKLEAGMLLRAQTKTKEDVFGDCLYRVEEVGMTMKSPGNPTQTIGDGIKCLMLGGSGPAARSGLTIMDSEAKIQGEIAAGIIEVVSGAKQAEIIAYYADKALDGTPRKVTGATGVMDFD